MPSDVLVVGELSRRLVISRISLWTSSENDHQKKPVILGERLGSPGMSRIFLLNEELKNPQNPQNHR